MSWKEIPNLNNDFTVARQQEEAQKIAREQQEHARQVALEQIKDKDERAKIEKLKDQRDKESARAAKLEKDQQERFEIREVHRRLDNQRSPQPRPEDIKSVIGKSPDQVAREVRDQNEKNRAEQIQKTKTKVEDFHNKAIDNRIEKALEKQQVQERSEPSFQSDAEKSARDRFDGASQGKDWRQIQAERMRDEFDKGR